MARSGSTPLVVADGPQVLGGIELHDVLKPGIREYCTALRRMGTKTIMVTGDNRLTAVAIAAEVGADDFLSEATPQRKLELIRQCQKAGHRVAMYGDGSNDAPALAQADLAVAMDSGAQAAKQAVFATTYPALNALNVTRLTSPRSAIVSAVIFSIVIIGPLLLLAVRGVKAREVSDARPFHLNLWVYGLGGFLLPWIGIKLIDVCLIAFRLV